MITTLHSEYNFEKKTSNDVIRTYGEGATLFTEHVIIQIMSDVWCGGECATYWDDAKGAPVKITFKCYDDMVPKAHNDAASATIDATPEVLRKYFCYLRDRAYEARLGTLQDNLDKAWAIFNKNDQVRITKGRTQVGQVGKVVALTSAIYNAAHRYSGWRNSPQPEQKLLIAFSDEKVDTYFPKYKKTYPVYTNSAWVWARNVVKVLVTKPTLSATDYEEASKHAFESTVRVFKQRNLVIPENI